MIDIFLRKLFLFTLPLIILSIAYIILDPFKVIKKYDSYYISDEIVGVSINRDYMSTSTFDNNSAVYKYDSFIFGNSRSVFYEVETWKAYLSSDSNCYHFDASGETLYGIYKKIQYLVKKSITINNALLILDYDTLTQVTSDQRHLFIISPQLEDNKNIIPFHLSFIKAFLTPRFMIAYFDYKISGKVKNYMKKNSLLSDGQSHYDIKTNESSWSDFGKLIENGEYYTDERMKVFYSRDTTEQSDSPRVIYSQQEMMLTEIKDIFQKHKTNYKIIINPLYDQKKLNKHDLTYLELLFGKNNVFDFSGINEFTNDYTNYYEASHYRPRVSGEILKIVYADK
ncbi:hypothetical protein AGMMS4952_09290 [Spirochaetia bacterium]|nr:hypothetical protein AGMMS4952_09290 [Spirochaetia bacterium]